MARRRDQEDVFKPLNDSPAEADEPQSQSSRRGWEIKLGLLTLVLLVGATGYFAYTHLTPGGDVDETAGTSGRLKLETETDAVADRRVVAGEVQVVAGAERVSDPRPLVMAQWNEVSEPEKPAQAGSWTSSESEADQIPQSLAAVPSQSYAANYGGDFHPQAAPSSETTLAPMPNPSNFTAGTAGRLPSESPTRPPEPLQHSLYGGGTATASSETPRPNYATLQGETAYSPPNAQSPGSRQAADAGDFGTASQSDYGPTAWKSQPEPPAAQTYSPLGQHQESRDYSAPAQGTYAGTAAATPNGGPLAASLPVQNSYPSYTPATTSKTQADYAGLSATRAGDERPAAEVWQQPTVIPVDGRYTAQPNDNFYTISKKVYGSGAYFAALAEYNKNKYAKASQIRIGDVVQTPPAETLESRYPELCPKPEHRDAAKRRTSATASRSLAGRRVYVVQEGDNLFDIARFELGARSRVAELIELNRDVLGDQINYLTPGMRLLLPETDERGPAVTQAPTNTLR